MKKLKAAIILDNLTMTKWQQNALEEASESLDIVVIFNCQNTKTKKDLKNNFMYYFLNVFTLKNSFTKRIKYNVVNEKVLSFNSIYKGSWQSIPKNISQNLFSNQIDVVIKFGMSLLKIDENLDQITVLSFHHGDPSKFRGRPAGFYELLYDEDKSGIIVQELTNKLDAGRVLAFAESKLIHHSYKKTAENFYNQSQFLLNKAIINLQNNEYLHIATDGKNYRLPSNSTVIYFFTILLQRKIKRTLYGAFYEKKWKVGTVNLQPDLKSSNHIASKLIKEIPIEPKYSFYADPFFSLDGSKIRLEALDKKTGLGDIIETDLEDTKNFRLLLTGKHYSYPFSFLLDEDEQLLPEVASHSPQYFFSLSKDNIDPSTFRGLEDQRLVDATLYKHNDIWFLFFGENTSAHSVLNLWTSDSLTASFKKHPCSPICISPSSARMAGRILLTENGLFRFGQNNDRGYGSAITISEITELSLDRYEEKVCGSITIDDYFGPHSIDFNKDKGIALIDYYVDEFSIFSGVRRFKALLSKN